MSLKRYEVDRERHMVKNEEWNRSGNYLKSQWEVKNNYYLKTIEKNVSQKFVSGGQRENKNKILSNKNAHYT